MKKYRVNWWALIAIVFAGVIMTFVARDMQGWWGMYNDSSFTNWVLYLLGSWAVALPIAFAVGIVVSVRKV